MIKLAALALYYRARETMQAFPLITDMHSVDMSKELIRSNPLGEVPRNDYVTQLATVCRAYLVNHAISEFDGDRIINLGCGFDTRGYTSTKEWVDVDRPEVIDARLKLVPEGGNSTTIAGDIQDTVFMDSLTNYVKTLVILEGVLDYYTQEEVHEILRSIKKLSSDVTIIFDAIGSLMRGVVHPALAALGIIQEVKWGLDSTKELEELGFIVDEVNFVHSVEKYRWRPVMELLADKPLYVDHASKVYVMRGVE